jgi:flagellar hook-associated protein 1 FlgK
VTVTNGGTSTVYAAGTPVPYTSGATISFGGLSFTLSGIPADGDTFTITPSVSGVGDNRNALLLGALQTANTLGNGTANYQSAYSQIVSQIGNKTRELEVTSSAAGKLLTEATTSLQNESGVNLDEEATNLLRYQQAYQAAGKVMQIASDMFNVLLSLGG